MGLRAIRCLFAAGFEVTFADDGWLATQGDVVLAGESPEGFSGRVGGNDEVVQFHSSSERGEGRLILGGLGVFAALDGAADGAE